MSIRSVFSAMAGAIKVLAILVALIGIPTFSYYFLKPLPATMISFITWIAILSVTHYKFNNY